MERDLRRSLWHEAWTLPLLFLTAALLAGLRLGADGALQFRGPTLLSLVLAVMLGGLLLRSALLVPARIVSSSRTGLANANGVVALLALAFASAQIFGMLTPNRGLLQVIFGGFFLAMLWMTSAARPDAAHLVRSLTVLFGSALVLRFVVLNGLAAPGGSLARRIFASALDGVVPGSLGLTYQSPAAGYAAFAALVLFFVALLLLPRDPPVAELLGLPAADRGEWRRG